MIFRALIIEELILCSNWFFFLLLEKCFTLTISIIAPDFTVYDNNYNLGMSANFLINCAIANFNDEIFTIIAMQDIHIHIYIWYFLCRRLDVQINRFIEILIFISNAPSLKELILWMLQICLILIVEECFSLRFFTMIVWILIWGLSINFLINFEITFQWWKPHNHCYTLIFIEIIYYIY